MRISPNHPRLRVVALACWAMSGLFIVQNQLLVVPVPMITAFAISTRLLALLLTAIGIAFWLISTDRQAGIVFDHKGLLLNLGHFSAFIAWENIEQVGISTHRSSLFAIGSHRQLGVMLKDTGQYVQSYESRLPASKTFLARCLRWLDGSIGHLRPGRDYPIEAELTANRTRTGFDVLIPESFLGGRADSFAELVEAYRARSAHQRKHGNIAWAP